MKSRAEAAMGRCIQALGRNAEAGKWFQPAVSRGDRAESAARLAFGLFFTHQCRASESVKVLERAQQSESHESRYELGLVLLQCDRREATVKSLLRAVDLDPARVVSRLLLAKIYRGLGRISDAEREEMASIADGPPDP